jgi:hypothetical protein
MPRAASTYFDRKRISMKHGSLIAAAFVALAAVHPSKAETTGEMLQALLPGPTTLSLIQVPSSGRATTS